MALITNEKCKNKEIFTDSIKEEVKQFGRALDQETAEVMLMGVNTGLLFNELIRRLDCATLKFNAIAGIVGGTMEVSPEIRKNMMQSKESYRVLFKTIHELDAIGGGRK